MAAVLIDRLPGAPLWGVEGWGDKRHCHTQPPLSTNTVLTVAHTEDHLCSMRHQALAFIYLHLLSLALLMEFQRLFSFLCLFELLMQKCSADSPAAKRQRQRDGVFLERKKTQALPLHSSLDLKETIWVILTLSPSR